MNALLISGFVGFVLSILGTPIAIRILRRQGIGQEIRDDGPTSHHSKRGTPTMGGLVIISATVLAYAGSHVFSGDAPSVSGVLLLSLFVALGFLGFLDDFIKVHRKRSLGLNGTAKIIGQLGAAVAFGALALQFRDDRGLTPASKYISFQRDIPALYIGTAFFLVLAFLIITATSNAVNLTDGLDGLASGTLVMVFLSYTIIAFWQFRHECGTPLGVAKCYDIRDSLDLAIIALAAAGACFGFLWWNGSPARIFMGDTGSLALGGLVGGLAILTKTELLLIFLGALFVIIALSVIIQVAFFRMTGKRVFRMAPLQHHFELAGWGEVTIVIRFWIVAGFAVAAGLGLFYVDFLVGQ